MARVWWGCLSLRTRHPQVRKHTRNTKIYSETLSEIGFHLRPKLLVLHFVLWGRFDPNIHNIRVQKNT